MRLPSKVTSCGLTLDLVNLQLGGHSLLDHVSKFIGSHVVSFKLTAKFILLALLINDHWHYHGLLLHLRRILLILLRNWGDGNTLFGTLIQFHAFVCWSDQIIYIWFWLIKPLVAIFKFLAFFLQIIKNLVNFICKNFLADLSHFLRVN